MATESECAGYVPGLRERICHRCLGPLPTELLAPPFRGPGTVSRAAAARRPAEGGAPGDPEGVCDRCLFLLLLEAITDRLPPQEVPGWMERPSHVLGGRTPRECIDAWDFEPVFEAVWLYGPPEGPVS